MSETMDPLVIKNEEKGGAETAISTTLVDTQGKNDAGSSSSSLSDLVHASLGLSSMNPLSNMDPFVNTRTMKSEAQPNNDGSYSDAAADSNDGGDEEGNTIGDKRNFDDISSEYPYSLANSADWVDAPNGDGAQYLYGETGQLVGLRYRREDESDKFHKYKYFCKEEGCDKHGIKMWGGRCHKHGRLHSEKEKQLITLLLNEATSTSNAIEDAPTHNTRQREKKNSLITLLLNEATTAIAKDPIEILAAASATRKGKRKQIRTSPNRYIYGTTKRRGRRTKGPYCKEPGCDKAPQGKGGKCREHGGNRPLCKIEGCEKWPVGKGGKCREHGGTKRSCIEEGCENQVYVKSRCKRHGRLHQEALNRNIRSQKKRKKGGGKEEKSDQAL